MVKEKVEIADLIAEKMEMSEVGVDHGNCPIEIEFLPKTGDTYPKNPEKNIHSLDDRLLSEQQLEICRQRLESVRATFKELIDRNEPVSAFEFICRVDPFYGAHKDALELREHPARIIGSMSPLKSHSRIKEESQETILRRSSSVSSLDPEDMPRSGSSQSVIARLEESARISSPQSQHPKIFKPVLFEGAPIQKREVGKKSLGQLLDSCAMPPLQLKH